MPTGYCCIFELVATQWEPKTNQFLLHLSLTLQIPHSSLLQKLYAKRLTPWLYKISHIEL